LVPELGWTPYQGSGLEAPASNAQLAGSSALRMAVSSNIPLEASKSSMFTVPAGASLGPPLVTDR
jgi:hypothetical protein